MQPFTVREVEHHCVTAGEVDGVEVRRVDVRGRGGIGQQRHLGIVGFPRLGALVVVGELERPRLQRGEPALRTDDRLLVAGLGEDVIGVGQLRQPQAGGLGRVLVVRDVGDNVQDALGHAARIPQPNPWRQKVATSHNLLAIHHLLRNQPPDLGSVPQDDSKPFDTAD